MKRINRFRNGDAMAKAVFQMLVKKVGTPDTWISNCYYMACVAVEQCRVPGDAVYGLWKGPVHPQSYFHGKGVVGFIRHGWVQLDDGRVLDPTRWVFEAAAPYVYVGANDHYDEGANQLREMTMRPAPAWDAEETQLKFTCSSEAWTRVEKLLNLEALYADDNYRVGDIDRAQAFWLANLPPDHLQPYTWEIYQWLKENDLQIAVPMDNWKMVERLNNKLQKKRSSR